MLFDLGPDETIIRNAKKRGIDLSLVDTVIISHGHWDHGGALEAFLRINDHAKIYIQKEAFAPHFRKYMGDEAYIGLKTSLMENEQKIREYQALKADDESSLKKLREEFRLKNEYTFRRTVWLGDRTLKFYE